jgi:long-subunit acyl-CoA synthetase (AMP-forming)
MADYCFRCAVDRRVPVPVYHSLDPQTTEDIANDAELEAALYSTLELSEWLDLLSVSRSIQRLVVMSDPIPDHRDVSILIVPWEENLASGEDRQDFDSLPDPDELALIVYTSGSIIKVGRCDPNHAPNDVSVWLLEFSRFLNRMLLK